jgi:hypothetical protein
MLVAVGVAVGRVPAVGAATTAPWLAGGWERLLVGLAIGRRLEEGSKSQAVGPIAGRNWKQVALVFSLPKTRVVRALPSCEEAGAFVVTPCAFRLTSHVTSAVSALCCCSCLLSVTGWCNCLWFLGAVPCGGWLSRRICTGWLVCCCMPTS